MNDARIAIEGTVSEGTEQEEQEENCSVNPEEDTVGLKKFKGYKVTPLQMAAELLALAGIFSFIVFAIKIENETSVCMESNWYF